MKFEGKIGLKQNFDGVCETDRVLREMQNLESSNENT